MTSWTVIRHFLKLTVRLRLVFSPIGADRFVNRIYLCGLSRNGSLIRTALDAIHYEYQLYWVTDAVAGLNAADKVGHGFIEGQRREIVSQVMKSLSVKFAKDFLLWIKKRGLRALFFRD